MRACVKATLLLRLVWPEETLIVSSWGRLLLLVWNHGSPQELLKRPQPTKNAQSSEWSVKTASKVPVPSLRGWGICMEWYFIFYLIFRISRNLFGKINKSKCRQIHFETNNSAQLWLGDTQETNDLWDTRQKCHNLVGWTTCFARVYNLFRWRL